MVYEPPNHRIPLVYPQHMPNEGSWEIVDKGNVCVLIRAKCVCGDGSCTFTSHISPDMIYDKNGQSLRSMISQGD